MGQLLGVSVPMLEPQDIIPPSSTLYSHQRMIPLVTHCPVPWWGEVGNPVTDACLSCLPRPQELAS